MAAEGEILPRYKFEFIGKIRRNLKGYRYTISRFGANIFDNQRVEFEHRHKWAQR
jgi:hypothetical protein